MSPRRAPHAAERRYPDRPQMTRRAATLVVALVVAALVGVALLAIPGSPLEQRPTLGLDLQGGLEVTLQAVPPRGPRAARRPTSTARSRSCATASTGSASPSPRSARRATTRSRSSSPASRIPAAAARIIGKTAQLELYDLEANLVAPSIDSRTREPIATAKLYDLLAGQQALAAQGRAGQRTTSSATKGKKLVRGPVATTRGGAREVRRRGARRGTSCSRVPPGTVVVSCGIGEVVCPGVAAAEPDHELLLPAPLRPAGACRR